MPRRSGQHGYAVTYEMHGREIASYLVIASDERDAEAQASALFYAQHPAFDSFKGTTGLSFRVEKRSSRRRWNR
jgi:hypothetical protein